MSTNWLISWIGNADLAATEGSEVRGAGPIATALLNGPRYDRVCLLTNYGHERSTAFCSWLERRCEYSGDAVDLQEIELVSPINYASIYAEA